MKIKIKASYSGRRLYQYNEDDYFIQVLIVNELFRIASQQVIMQRELFELTASSDFYVLFVLRIHILFNTLIQIKN